jgi:hypothetical protein
MAEPTVIDVVMTDTGHPGLGMAIAEIGLIAEAIHKAIGGQTAIEALLCVYLNMAVDQLGLAEAQGALKRAQDQLPQIDRVRQTLGPTRGTS